MSANVLLIDDETDFLSVMAERMTMRGMQVATASSARDGLAKVEAGDFDVVVLDLAMPEMDGVEALKQLKAKKPDLEVILLTGHASVKQGIEAMKLGALELLEKPADMKALIARIEAIQAQKHDGRPENIMGGK
ncbi:MAG: response regulator [Desulfobulbaceae bacterium]|jgi:DNA-binding NtrC family response regulator|nr:response regulator [Desulfobulbaceae bacterium]